MLCQSNLVFAADIALLAAASGPVLLALAWLVLGAGMALGLPAAGHASERDAGIARCRPWLRPSTSGPRREAPFPTGIKARDPHVAEKGGGTPPSL